jgi:hypothetical protein
LAQAPSGDQARCLKRIHALSAKLSATLGRAALRCVKIAAASPSGSLSGVTIAGYCIPTLLAERVDKAQEKLEEAATTGCPSEPDFGKGDPAAIRVAIDIAWAGDDGFGRVVGPTQWSSAPSHEGIDGCAVALLRRVGKMAKATDKSFAVCVKRAIATDSLTSAVDVAACVGADPNGKIAISRTKFAEDIAVHCTPASIDGNFPDGECSDEVTVPDFSTCAVDVVDCVECRVLNAVASTTADCDQYDDGAINGSCPQLASPSGAFLEPANLF